MGESGTHCFEESRGNSHDEREGRRNSDMPSNEVESLHRLQETELRDNAEASTDRSTNSTKS